MDLTVMTRIDTLDPSLLDAIDEEERAVAYLTESAYHESHLYHATEFDVHRPFQFSDNEDEDDQHSAILTNCASPNGVALGEDAM
jgi:hypothetical protein